MRVIFHGLNPSRKVIQVAAGATLGQEHLRPLREKIQNADGEIVVLDFSRIRAATASYLKATIIWLIQSGRLSAIDDMGQPAPHSPQDPIPLAIYPLATGLDADVRHELDAVLPSHRLPCLEALKHSDRKILTAALHGPLDDALSDTLKVLTQCGSGTASSLCRRFEDRKISASGWSNRLADLHMLRLAMRRKEVRQWLYEQVSAEVRNGRAS